MASTRPIKLDDWGISWAAYKEMEYHCLQYERKKKEGADGNKRQARDADDIEIAASIANEDYAPFILRLVTTRIGVDELLKEMQYAITKNRLYEMRTKFFVTLHGIKEGSIVIV